MKRFVMAMVVMFALLFTAQTAKADWYVWVDASGWAHWEYDGTFGDDDFDPPLPPPLPRGKRYFLLFHDDIWYVTAY